MVHRDIKRSKLMLSSERDRAVISVHHFGVAKAAPQVVHSAMVPEPAMNRSVADAAMHGGFFSAVLRGAYRAAKGRIAVSHQAFHIEDQNG